PVVFGGKEAPPFRIALADASGVLHLLEGPAWNPLRTWSLGGKITAGPLVRGKHLACVVDHRRLVWIDPGRADSAWEYTGVADIVGAPQVVGELVVLANAAGQFIGVEVATGRPRGSYTLRTSAAAAVAPVAFGPDRLFAPLPDR